MNRPDFIKLVEALKGGTFKSVGFKPTKPENLMGSEIKRLWMLGLWKWRTTFMLPELGDIWPWNWPNPT
jgi:hypothetical protein